MIAKHLECEHCPLVGDTADDLADLRLQHGVILLRWPRVRSKFARRCF
jgi:hypothetical protein